MTDSRLLSAHRAAVRQYGRGQAARWRACFAAALVVGAYTDATRLLAADMGVTVDAVEKMAQAAVFHMELYRYFRNISEPEDWPGIAARLRQLRSQLSPSHYAVMGQLQRRYDMGFGAVLAQLETARESRTPVRDLAIHAEAAERAEQSDAERMLADYLKALESLARAARQVLVRAEAAGVKNFKLTLIAEDASELLRGAVAGAAAHQNGHGK